MPDRIGPFEILSELGRGGMGVVHLARDTRLDRQVAVKALPEHLTTDLARLERFEREARTLAALHHPNIAGIHGVEEQDGARYLILEYVPGDTLADLLDRGPLPVDDAIEHAAQIAAGLEAAHEAGIVHRDLKPANIRITPDGVAKILDFGLARADDGTPSSAGGLDSPTLTTPHPKHSPTIEGAILGTAAYMSPEQARGRRVDKRSDIWSFGVVLYEMLVGSSPFHGETATDSIGAILHKNINLDLLPPQTPLAVRRVLARCLERDKNQRFRDIGDVRLELLNSSNEQPAVVPAAQRRRSVLPMVGLAIVIASAAGWFAARSSAPGLERPVRKYDLVVETPTQKFTYSNPQVSPDGSKVAYLADEKLHIRELNSFESRVIETSSEPVGYAWSPDSRQIAVFTRSGIFKSNLTDGSMVQITRQSSAQGMIGGGWTDDGRIIFAEEGGIRQVSAQGGTPTDVLTESNSEIDFHRPSVIQGTDVILFVQHNRDQTLVLQAFDGKNRVTIAASIEPPIVECCYSPTGHIMYTRGWAEPSIWAIPFDAAKMRVTGEPFVVLNNASRPSVSQDGTLVALRGPGAPAGHIALIDRHGTITRMGESQELIAVPMLSNDETRVAFMTGNDPNKSDIWIYDRTRGTNTRLTFNEMMCMPTGWSPDDSELAVMTYDTQRVPVLQTRFYHTDGSGESRDPIELGLASFDSNWKWAATELDPLSEKTSVKAVSLERPNEITDVVSLAHLRWQPKLSPSGELLAYTIDDAGRVELYCTRFPSGQGKWLVTNSSVESMWWSSDSSKIYYLTKDKQLMQVAVAIEPSIRFGVPELVVAFPETLSLDFASISSTNDDQQFIAIQLDIDESEANRISVIENWFEEFRTSNPR